MTVARGCRASQSARQAGFANISLDLMFALPGQSRDDLAEDLQTYLDLAPEHFSCYGLTAEPGTPLHAKVTSGALILPDEDLYADSFMLLHDRLSAAGYTHYEIANYARDGFDCQHNLSLLAAPSLPGHRRRGALFSGRWLGQPLGQLQQTCRVIARRCRPVRNR